jgi:hypothetical protein
MPTIGLLYPRQAAGTDEMMQRLPAYERFQCMNCHTIPSPTDQIPDLNPFGDDFLANDGHWDRVLALMNSDGDRCSNGSELGDRDGNGVLDDAGRPRENGNPGDPADCTAPIDAATWGIIKDLFSTELDVYELDEPETDFYTLYFAP